MNSFSLPTGAVTFLFTDFEGSTKLAQQYQVKMHNEQLVACVTEE